MEDVLVKIIELINGTNRMSISVAITVSDILMDFSIFNPGDFQVCDTDSLLINTEDDAICPAGPVVNYQQLT